MAHLLLATKLHEISTVQWKDLDPYHVMQNQWIVASKLAPEMMDRISASSLYTGLIADWSYHHMAAR
jgi:hypothetical protein